jgi:hypothetical protein
MLNGLKSISMGKKLVAIFLLISVFSFSKDFWEKRNFTANVSESLTINGSKKTKRYIMSYHNGTMKLQITAPSINKGEIYTFTGNSKTIYYPSLKQTVKQKIQKDEANILGVFNKLSKLTSKKTQTKGNDTFVFTNNWLTSIKSGGVTVGFSDYKKVGEYTYPTKIFVTDGNSRVVYYLSNFK